MMDRLDTGTSRDLPHKKRRFSLPRKGRIRVVLLIVLCAAAGFILLRKQPAASVDDTARSLVHQLHTRKKDPPHTRRQLYRLLQLYPPRLTHARDTLYFSKDPMVIHYSLDEHLQRLTRRLLRRYHPRYGAAVALQPATGRILAMVSYTHPDQPPRVDNLCTEACFPAASIFKVITAAAAFDTRSLTPSSAVRVAGRNHTLYRTQLDEHLPRYRTITFQEAFAYSINPAFGRIGIHMLGDSTLTGYARRFGFQEHIPFCLPVAHSTVLEPDSAFNIAELASGFNDETEISPLHGALISAAVAYNGTMMKPVLIDSITQCSTGTRMYRAAPAVWKKDVISAHSSARLRDCMQQVARYGTARSAFRYVKRSFRFNDIAYGGKTGSIDKDDLGKVDWFSGFAIHETDTTQQVCVGVVTVHGAYWTVHSSFVGAEMMRHYIRHLQRSSAEDRVQRTGR
jgi:cell division protein FtsI/penicillin-binding protein 2